MNVYVLKPNLSDPRFAGCVFDSKAKSVLGFETPFADFLPENGESLDWEPRELASRWSPQPVAGPANAFNDYPCLELLIPAFSRRAMNALSRYLTDNGELLPLRTRSGDYSALNLKTKLDALDVRKSVLRRTDSKSTAVAIKYFAFKESKIRQASIFRVREHPSLYLVTEKFKDCVDAARLNGFNFVQVWPLPDGSDWHMDEAKRRKASKSTKLVGEALVIRLRLTESKPSRKEKANTAAFLESLSSALRVDSLNDRYFGSVEVAEFEDHEFRVFCTCPDCEVLHEHIQSCFEEMQWENEVDVVMRYGNLYDVKAKERRVVVR